MKKDNKGFTLIEMLVCIGIIAALGVVIGLSATTVINNTKYAKNESTMKDLFTAASVYIELSENATLKDSCKSNSTGCTVSLSDLTDKGLVDKFIYDERDPLLISGNKFNGTTSFTVIWTSDVKDVSYCGIKLSTIESTPKDKWGSC